MELRDPSCTVKGNVLIGVYDGRRQRLIDRLEARNRFVLSGRTALRNLLGFAQLGGSGLVPDYIGLGTSSTAAADGQTQLGTEVFRKLITRRLPRDSAFILQLFVDTTEANGNTLREVGLFEANAGGTMWARATHTGIVKTGSISVVYAWTFTFAVPA